MAELKFVPIDNMFIDMEFKDFLYKLPVKENNQRINKIKSRFYNALRTKTDTPHLSKAKKIELMVEYGYFNLTRTI